MALSVPVPRVARTIRSPNRAASSKVPAVIRPPVDSSQSWSFPGSRDPILTSCPTDMKPLARTRPTSPEPRTPTLTLLMHRDKHGSCLRPMERGKLGEMRRVALPFILLAALPALAQTQRVPLVDLGTSTYLGFE